MKITIHRGSHQVGGSCVEIAAGGSRIIIDAGLPLEDSPSPALPAVDGLSGDGEPIDGILLSHAHPDHSGLLNQTREEIPIWCSRGTSKMMTLASLFTGAPRVPRARMRSLLDTKPQPIGAFHVTALPVDHSIYGSSAFLIEHAGKRVLYSGDLRLHGRKPGMARRLIQAASPGLDALIMEGTHIGAGRAQGVSEVGLEKEIELIMRDTTGLILCMFSPMNLDRLVTFYKASRRVGRIFVPDLYAATCMRFVNSEVKIPIPNVKSGMRVYFNQTARRSTQLRRPFLQSEISLEMILREPSRYAILSRPSMVARDFRNTLPPLSTCIYSMWSGYLNRPDWKEFQEVVAGSGGRLESRHASGHIYVDDIVNLVQELAPKVVIPIHTSSPEQYASLSLAAEVAPMNDGQSLSL